MAFVIGLLLESFIWPAIVTVVRRLAVLSAICIADSGVGVVTAGFSGEGAAAGVGVASAAAGVAEGLAEPSATPVTGTVVVVGGPPGDEAA